MADDYLTTMEPNPAWDPAAHEDAVDALAAIADDCTIHVWGGDWCTDCRGQLPDFGAALDAAGVPADRVHHHAVAKADDGSKHGPLVGEYDIELIPTVVVERDGAEVARFVEEAPVGIAEALAEQLSSASA